MNGYGGMPNGNRLELMESRENRHEINRNEGSCVFTTQQKIFPAITAWAYLFVLIMTVSALRFFSHLSIQDFQEKDCPLLMGFTSFAIFIFDYKTFQISVIL